MKKETKNCRRMYGKYLFIIISPKNIHLVTQSLCKKGQKFVYSRRLADLHIEAKTEKLISEYSGVYARIFLYS